MKPKIFISQPVPEKVEQYLREHCEVKEWRGEDRIPRETLLQEIANVEGLLTAWHKIDEELLAAAPNLKVVSNVSVGYNNFDVEALRGRNVIGTNTPYVLDDTVADLTIALMLATARRIAELDQYVKAKKWEPVKDEALFFGVDVHHATIGIIGMGRIGEAVAQRAKFGFNMDVLYHNRSQKPEAEKKYEAEYCELPDLLRRADFVVMLTPLTEETHHLLGEQEFKQMKKSAIFVNVSRGQTVDELALITALQNGDIYGAGLDVFQKEPIEKDNPLLEMSNVVTVPHIGSATAQTREAMAMRAAQNIVSVLQGKGAIDPVYK
ncbi:2-hydroxyacid dehydrogenase [Lederbergia galactosidilytica]|uniref:Bifunctional glyoxylate/hydroxypyruvate reductase B n=1 Tax=Lederbergia galactosidilytica TaxID=217031 RepID=A0A177ZLA1_9BACI|nr:D-glycerate dehydrogenase [Lederbergia galactosidilytica]KRG15463.1 bifunctional glyoxylate/hydroxypyruvate reductase B [Virgibacillus soli]MBP1916249.1 gluconate 2-dehydrogenase [Lederbergia galactosidilytica]OAK68363.1 bifunctional glyoxylate/hydroxypyruvate reductase B [Lederbergia galactosidilytica]